MFSCSDVFLYLRPATSGKEISYERGFLVTEWIVSEVLYSNKQTTTKAANRNKKMACGRGKLKYFLLREFSFFGVSHKLSLLLEFASPTRRGSDTKRGKSAPRRQIYENE